LQAGSAEHFARRQDRGSTLCTIENPPRTQAKADVLDGRKRGLVNIDAEQGEVPGQPA
jgi:hypothetical protein